MKELPDYLPLFLEYCSLLPQDQGCEQLGEIGYLLELLHARLQVRDSPYAALFSPLMHLAGVQETSDVVRKQVDDEERVVEGIVRTIVEELQLEDRLNEEVREVLVQHTQQMERSDITYSEMFKKVKRIQILGKR